MPNCRSPSFPHRPRSPLADDVPRRGEGLAHGDNTTGAFRYAPSLSGEVLRFGVRSPSGSAGLAGAPGPASRPPAAAAFFAVPAPSHVPPHAATHALLPAPKSGSLARVRPTPLLPAAPQMALSPTSPGPALPAETGLPGTVAAWLPLPPQLLLLLGGLPGLLNNLRHAQRSVAWWRYFDGRQVVLAQQRRALAAGKAGAVQPLPLLQAAFRSSCREAMGLQLAVREANFHLGFNVVESASYLMGWLPLLARRLVGRPTSWQQRLTGSSLLWLLLASGLLHVLQRAAALSTAQATQRAVAQSDALPLPLAATVGRSCGEEVRFHAVQLGCWLGFCLGLVATGAAGLGPTLTLLGGATAVASMLVARLQRIYCGRRYDLPDNVLWQAEADAAQQAPLHRRRAFAEPDVQAATLATLLAQKRHVAALQASLLARHLPSLTGVVLARLTQLSHLPGIAPLLSLSVTRWIQGSDHALATTLLSGHLPLWQAQLALAEVELDGLQTSAARHAPDASPNQLGALNQTLSQALQQDHAERRRMLLDERDRLRALLFGTRTWLADHDADPAEVWAVLTDTWQLRPPPPNWWQRGKTTAWAPIGPLYVTMAAHLDDDLRALVWACKLSCLQRAEEIERPFA